MREEAINWWEQALKDLEIAKKNLDIESFFSVLFYHNKPLKKH